MHESVCRPLADTGPVPTAGPTADPPRQGTVADLADLLAAYPGTLVLSGAGLSTESGIPDYRGPDGKRRVQPMEHGEFVGSSAARQRYWARSFIGWGRFAAARPNAGHRAVTALQASGALGGIITQNVDGLHQLAGARRVIDLHGTLARVLCLTCGTLIGRDYLQVTMARANPGFAALATGAAADGSQVSSQIRPDGDVVIDEGLVARFVAPLCPRCGSDAVKPDVVFFGGSVPRERVERCIARTDAAPALLVLGSSLQVMSGLRFVRQANARGIPIVIVTRGPTRGDSLAMLRLDAPLGATLTEVARRLAPARSVRPEPSVE